MRLGALALALLVLFSGAARGDQTADLAAQRAACAAAMTRQCLLDLLPAPAAEADAQSRVVRLAWLAAAYHAAGAEARGDALVRQFRTTLRDSPEGARFQAWGAFMLGFALATAGEAARAHAVATEMEDWASRNYTIAAIITVLAEDGQAVAAADLVNSYRLNLRGYSDMVTAVVHALARQQRFAEAIDLANDGEIGMLGPAMSAVAIEQARAGLQAAARESAAAATPGVQRVGPEWFQANVRGVVGIAQMSAGLEEQGRASFLIGRRAVLEVPQAANRIRGITLLVQFLAAAGYDDDARALIAELADGAARAQASLVVMHAQLARGDPDAARATAQGAPAEHRDAMNAELAAYFAARGNLAAAGALLGAIGGDEILTRTIPRIVRYARP